MYKCFVVPCAEPHRTEYEVAFAVFPVWTTGGFHDTLTLPSRNG
jgi:hypothetical protein